MNLQHGYAFYRSLDLQGKVLHIGIAEISGDRKTLCGSRRSVYPYSFRSTQRTCAECRRAYRAQIEREQLKAAGHIDAGGRLVF
jgi:hypothetical protein